MSAVQLTSFFSDESAVLEIIDLDEEGESKKDVDDEMEKEFWYSSDETRTLGSNHLRSSTAEQMQIQYSCDFAGLVSPPPEFHS